MLHEIPEAVTLQQMKSVWHAYASITCTLMCVTLYYVLTSQMSAYTRSKYIDTCRF